MKAVKQILCRIPIFAMLFVAVSCSRGLNDSFVNDGQSHGKEEKVFVSFDAIVSDNTISRTLLENEEQVYWNDGDAIALFSRSGGFVNVETNDLKFVASIPEGKSANASFSGYTVPDAGPYTAFYPFEQCLSYGYWLGGIRFTIPMIQTATANSFAPHTNPAWARTDVMGGELRFSNIGALVKFSLKGDVNGLISVTLADNNTGSTLTGGFWLDDTDVQNPVLAAESGAIVSNQVTLEGTFESGKSYYMVIAPLENVLSEGFVLTFIRQDGTKYIKKAKSGVITEVAAGEIVNLGEIDLAATSFQTIIAEKGLITAVEKSCPSVGWVKNEDGTVPLTEDNKKKIAQVTELDLSSCGLTSLEDIKYFTGLTSLNCSYNGLSVLDVSNLQELTDFSCSGNELSVLDIAHLAKLSKLDCSYNNLSSLEVANLTNLTELRCGGNDLSSLDIANLINLTYLNCSSNNLSSLDIKNLTKLTWLTCDMNNLSSLDVSNQINLERLECYWNNLSALDVSGLTELTFLSCNDNNLSSLDLTNNLNIEILECYNQENGNPDSKLYLKLNKSREEWWNAQSSWGKESIEVEFVE